MKKKPIQRSHAHHYVPQWYQRRFLEPGRTKFYYLDLHPETLERNGVRYQRNALLQWGPSRCFYKNDLYTLAFGKTTTDHMERLFFGPVDFAGSGAMPAMAEFSGIASVHPRKFEAVRRYMGAQRFRTPRGLDEIRHLASYEERGPNSALVALGTAFEAYATMWTEGVWEIVRARQSPSKFIVTDDPLTFYCKVVFPSEWRYPNDVSLKQIGTRTIFPLSLDSCLIITHLQLVRNPWSTPTMFRENARYFDSTMKHLGDIQFGRELEEDEVLRINYILKKRATRYIAASEEEWLHPERRISTVKWGLLDEDWFMLPNLWKVRFTTGYAMGGDGWGFAIDEYGRRPTHGRYEDRGQREREHETFDQAKREWARRRIGKSIAHVDNYSHQDSVSNRMMSDFLRDQGLVQRT
jgi:Protein of unknown function (DUF4238)